MAALNSNLLFHTSTSVSSLLNMSLQSLINHIPKYLEDLNRLPPNIKDKLLHLMSKRGLVTDENISRIIHNNIRILDLSECDVTDTGLQHLSRCPNLKKLDLNSAKQSRTDITSEGIMHVAECCPQLQIVYLRRCLNLTDDAVIALSQRCPQLRELNIGGCLQITDTALEALGQNSRFLKCLNFSKTNVTDSGVISLCNGVCSNVLKEVHMDGCVHLTDDAVEAAVSYCPRIAILLFHGCPKITDRSRQAIEEMSEGGHGHMKQVTWTIY